MIVIKKYSIQYKKNKKKQFSHFDTVKIFAPPPSILLHKLKILHHFIFYSISEWLGHARRPLFSYLQIAHLYFSADLLFFHFMFYVLFWTDLHFRGIYS